ncbi:MAG: hypothetical protein MZV65_42645 [Chromatiales bacterium]|nr:hypothetical protein [Chromatiales bacterium]
MDAGYRVHLANTTAIKKYEGLKYSGDFADAAYPAQLLRLGLLPEGYIYPREQREALTWRASACNWCATASRSCRSRTRWRAGRSLRTHPVDQGGPHRRGAERVLRCLEQGVRRRH